MRKEFTDNEASVEFKKKLLISEHSPIRQIEFYWKWDNIKYWVSTEWSRHKFEKTISSQRNDRQGDYDRNAARQDAPVDYIGWANEQNLIDSFRKRLCRKATDEARLLAEDFKIELSKVYPLEADVLVPHCVYRCGCSEPNCCGLWFAFLNWCEESKEEIDLLSIQGRYDAYNKWFKETHCE
ncbi:hypothetical protein [Treponema bryantii]|nr:hypothetical protein [Treponema bryantii]